MTMRSTNIDIHSRPVRRTGFTLMEMLMSVVLTLILMFLVAQVFSVVGSSVNDSRALLGLSDRLRGVQARLEMDLEGITARMIPPAEIGNNEGYFELIEGPVGPVISIEDRAISTDVAGYPAPDTTAIDYDDILMFTTCTTTNEPFIGRAIVINDDGTNAYVVGDNVESRFAEVAWFVRGRTLYRRVKIIKPDFDFDIGPSNLQLTCTDLYGGTTISSANLGQGVLGGLNNRLINGLGTQITVLKDITNPMDAAFENLFDLSTHIKVYGTPVTWRWVPNSLADLTKRENRMYHAPFVPGGVAFADRFPFAVHSPDTSQWQWQVLGLPTLGETSNLNWMQSQWNAYGTIYGPELPTISLTSAVADLDPTLLQLDFWKEPYPYSELDPITGNLTETALQAAAGTGVACPHQRAGEDVILTNVIGFDVKVWDPEAPVISDGTTVLKPGDPGYPKSYDFVVGPPRRLRDLVTNTPPYDIVDYGAFVDLGHNYRPKVIANISTSVFSGPCNLKSGFDAPVVADYVNLPTTIPPFVYDTWSTHYEHDGIDQDNNTVIDGGYDGLDNDPDGSGPFLLDGVVDDVDECDTSPPYPVPLKAIQIKIRVFEPKSRKVREVTIVHRFSKK